MKLKEIFTVPFLIILFTLKSMTIEKNKNNEFTKLRELMVKTQIQARGVKDKRVLTAMLKVERHKFVPENIREYAYEDRPLSIGEGQTISQPYIVAYMTELLQLKGNEKVLEIGTGSGYQAAILAELCKYVYTIEIIPSLAIRAEKLLKELNYKNIKIKIGDGYLGWKEYAPFDRIIVTCAPDEIPQTLIDQLSDNGCMVIPVGSYSQELVLLKKVGGKIIKKSVLPVRFVPMIHKEKEK
jgi:protein-L-isoaspartate(D-aspartate) O-methyltransferase